MNFYKSDGFIESYANKTVNTLFTPNIASFNRRAVLFIFSPRNVVDHFKRPLVYNFGIEFADTAARYLSSTVGNNAQGLSQFMITPEASQGIVPSVDGIPFKTSQYSNQWTFLLLVTDDSLNPSVIQRAKSKCIYIGMFSEEPINPNTINLTSPTFNPKATMIITRKIVMNRLRTEGMNGPIVKDDLMADISKFHYDNSIIETPDKRIFNTQANHIIKNVHQNNADAQIHDDEENDEYFNVYEEPNKGIEDKRSFSVTDYGGLGSPVVDKDDCLLETVQHSPKNQLRQIGKAMVASMEYYDYEKAEENFLGITSNPGDIIAESAASFMENNSIYISKNIGLNRDRYSIQEILSRYNPEIFTIKSPASTGVDIIPQNIKSPVTVFSSLVSSTLPSFLSRVGLSGVSFMYNSHHSATKVYHIESIVPVDQKGLVNKWNMLFSIMKFELFTIIEAAAGPFDLAVNCFINGSTYVRLNFMDEAEINHFSVYEENNLLGGIVSPGVGNFNVMSNNSRDLGTLVNYVSDKTFLTDGGGIKFEEKYL